MFSIKDKASGREKRRETPVAGDDRNKDEIARSYGVKGSVFAAGLKESRPADMQAGGEPRQDTNQKPV